MQFKFVSFPFFIRLTFSWSFLFFQHCAAGIDIFYTFIQFVQPPTNRF